VSNAVETATHICRALQSASYGSVFSGGAVRDSLCGESPRDVDILTSAEPEQAIEIILALGGKALEAGTAKLIVVARINGMRFDIRSVPAQSGETFRDVIYRDSFDRDLTINSMYLDPVTGEYIDFHEGQADMKAGILRAVQSADNRIAEDPLRMMRACRFAGKFGFQVDSELAESVKRNAHRIVQPVGERLREELIKLLRTRYVENALELLHEYGLLAVAFPELEAMVEAHNGLWEHVKRVVAAIPDREAASEALLLAALYHDAGKTTTHRLNRSGRHSFYGHEVHSERMFRQRAEQLRLSNATVDDTAKLIRVHMKLHGVRLYTKRRLRKLLSDPLIQDMIVLQHADVLGKQWEAEVQAARSMQAFLKAALSEWEMSPEAQRLNSKPLLSGSALIAAGLPPGKQFGVILEGVREAQWAGEISTVDQAMALAMQLAIKA